MKMLVKQFQGLWFLYDGKDHKLYAYEKEPKELLWLGSVDPVTEVVTFRPDWHDAYATKLIDYRANEKPKNRVPTAL